MKALAILATVVTVTLLAPSLVMLYALIFGGHFTDNQGAAAFVLLIPGILAGGATAFFWSEVNHP